MLGRGDSLGGTTRVGGRRFEGDRECDRGRASRARNGVGIGGQAVGRWRLIGDVPFEFECEVARASAVAEASHVESSAAAARHDVVLQGDVDAKWLWKDRAAVDVEVVERERESNRIDASGWSRG